MKNLTKDDHFALGVFENSARNIIPLTEAKEDFSEELQKCKFEGIFHIYPCTIHYTDK